MTNLLISGVCPRNSRGVVRPHSVLTLFDRSAVPGCWSGLYGLNATREGLRELLSQSRDSQVVFRVACEVPGEIVTRMTTDNVLDMGYLNVRYADASLMRSLRDAWHRLGDLDDADAAMHYQPHLVRDVLNWLGFDTLKVVIHPFVPLQSDRVLMAGTILDRSVIRSIECRQHNIHIRLD